MVGKIESKVANWISPTNKQVRNFERLYWDESRQIGDFDDDWVLDVQGTNNDEPWVAFTPKDRFGIALSGGGIRSATFNLGLLQALTDLGVLGHVHYLSTVSGGGYIAGFWSAWRTRPGNTVDPSASPFTRTAAGEESKEVRHLREFSRFLLPRLGILETEFWGTVTTVLGGFLPAFIAAMAVLGLTWIVWLLIIAVLQMQPMISAPVFALLVAGFLTYTEREWRKAKKSELDFGDRDAYAGAAAAAVTGSLVGWLLLAATMGQHDHWAPIVGTAACDNWPPALRPVVVLAVFSLAALLVKVVVTRFLRTENKAPALRGFERAVTRMLALTAAAFGMALLWLLAQWLVETGAGTGIRLVSATTGGLAALFAALKNWFSKPTVETPASSLFRLIARSAKRITPKILAWIVVFGLAVLVGAGIHWTTTLPSHSGWMTLWIWAGSCVAILVLTLCLFDPARIGLHDFYRSRISRCYLGASNPRSNPNDRQDNRQVVERPDDDVLLNQLATEGRRPVHLICVAANDMSGDPLGTLYRGAKSAVLSGNGISLGDKSAKLETLRLSTALTASAAAFNPQMGRVSVDLGPAVTFLMAALNLRLGLWVPHPDNESRANYTFPGRFFLYELLGQTRTNGRHLHLSDGGHFENFGLYELVRRHCRHIVVSDCGADPSSVFDDLANVIRRIREDFGVEIEIDVGLLRPGADGNAKQHAVIGTIHYDGPAGLDKGSLIYFKPVLTGDEPADVLQYHSRNFVFPQQSTEDQFYDEPQWESYRRLGEHAGRSVLGFLEKPRSETLQFTDYMFFRSRDLWQPGPEDQKDSFLAMSAHCAELEAAIIACEPSYLSGEFFSESNLLGSSSGIPLRDGPGLRAERAEEARTLSCLMRVLQLMEDAWLANDLDRYWSHPLNQGWLAYFHRWAATASLQRWWPVLAPIYGSGFRSFAEERLGLGLRSDAFDGTQTGMPTKAELTLTTIADLAEVSSSELWREFVRQRRGPVPPGKTPLVFDLRLLGRDGQLDTIAIPVGLAFIRETVGDNSSAAVWNASDLFVPPRLHGAGITGRFLDAIIDRYRNANPPGKPCRSLWVDFKSATMGSKPGGSDAAQVLGPAARLQRVREVEFYKSRGFEYRWEEDRSPGDVALVLNFK